MPIYEYICQDCTKQFEVLSTSSRKTETVQCPSCQSPDVKKAMSAAAAVRMHQGSTGASAPCAASGCPRASGFS